MLPVCIRILCLTRFRRCLAECPRRRRDHRYDGLRRADALGLVAESALAAGLDRGTAGDRYQVVVHVDADGLGDDAEAGQSALEDGIGVSAQMSRRPTCDASSVVMTHAGDGRVLDVGRKTRTVPPAIRRALTARDRRCRFPGCDAYHCDAHHVRHWADGGATRLDNVAFVCRHQHRAVHEEGFTVELGDENEARFFWPDGRPGPDVPPTPTWAGTALASTDAHLETAGRRIDPHTATPDWLGERLDLDWAMTVLHPATADPPHSDLPAGTPPAPRPRPSPRLLACESSLHPSPPLHFKSPRKKTSHFRPPMHPVRRRYSSVEYCPYAPSSRLASRAPRRPKMGTYSYADPNLTREVVSQIIGTGGGAGCIGGRMPAYL